MSKFAPDSPQRIEIASAAQLQDVLASSNVTIRTAVLQAIMDEPATAAAKAAAYGCDLFCELVSLHDAAHSQLQRDGYAAALLQLPDERVVTFALRQFLDSDSSDIIVAAAARLAVLAEPQRIELLAPVVMMAGNQVRCRAAANLLAHCESLELPLTLRVAVLADHCVSVPSLQVADLPVWLAALQGDYPLRTKRLLLHKNDGSFTTMLEHWEQLPVAIRRWALQAATAISASGHMELVRTVLTGEHDVQLLVTALGALREPEPLQKDVAQVSRLRCHADPAVRTAAVLCAAVDGDWRALLADETDEQVHIAIVTRIGCAENGAHLDLLVGLLPTAGWRLRAAITTALVALSPASLPVIDQLQQHEQPEIVAIAAQALQRLECLA